MLSNKKPCNECPFRKQSAPGYLGETSYNPTTFLLSIEHDPIPCHLAVDWDDDDSNPDDHRYEIPCIGGLQFLRNTAKMPRNPEYCTLRNQVQLNNEVFQTRQQFIDHHSHKDEPVS
jgi:hypothetical protein